MQLTTIISTLALAVAAVNAIPSAEGETIEKRQVSNVLQLWVNYCYDGSRYQGNAANGACVNLPTNFRDRASSGKPKLNYDCWIYDLPNCRGDNYGISANDPKFSRLNNKAASWRCSLSV